MKCLHNSDLLCIDGIGTQIGFSWLNRQWLSRVVAEELFHDFLDTTRTRSKPLHAAMIGIEADSINLAADTIESYTKGLSINYRWHGFEQPDAYKERLAAISGNKPVDLILIGAGSPKSELIAQHALNLTRAPVIWHIGAGTIKTWAGTKRRAPAILSRTGTQWLHRFVFEPHTRSRYLRGGMEFAGNLFHSRTEPLQLSCKSREKNDESTYR